MQTKTVEGSVNAHKVFLFALSTCGWCRRSREFFESNDVAYEYIYVDLLMGDERREVLSEFPQLAVASDQPYREFDLAIDFREDVPPQPWSVVDRVVEIFREHGASVKVSSIHVNGWFGDYDKLKTCKLFARERLGLDLDRPSDRGRCAFVGDSANDEPMFAYFPLATAVANIKDLMQWITHEPAYVTDRRGGEGFAQMVDVILTARGEITPR